MQRYTGFCGTHIKSIQKYFHPGLSIANCCIWCSFVLSSSSGWARAASVFPESHLKRTINFYDKRTYLNKLTFLKIMLPHLCDINTNSSRDILMQSLWMGFHFLIELSWLKKNKIKDFLQKPSKHSSSINGLLWQNKLIFPYMQQDVKNQGKAIQEKW